MMFKIQDVNLVETFKEGLSNGLWGTLEDSDPGTGTQAIAHLIKAVVHRPYGVVAATCWYVLMIHITLAFHGVANTDDRIGQGDRDRITT